MPHAVELGGPTRLGDFVRQASLRSALPYLGDALRPSDSEVRRYSGATRGHAGPRYWSTGWKPGESTGTGWEPIPLNVLGGSLAQR